MPETEEMTRGVLIGVITDAQAPNQVKEYLDELEFLSQTLGIKSIKKFTQRLNRPNSATFINGGKLDEIVLYAKNNGVEVLVFDDELSASQAKNIEKILKAEDVKCKILDRSTLILEIFNYRAKTAQAKTQVELARYQYMLPRLVRMWTHLERQRGGIGQRGGAGEKEIETDRRIIRDKIALLKQKLEKIDKQNETRRKRRDQFARVALVGYTNVGKSTLMRLLSKEKVFAENKLFATVDSTVRKVFWKGVPFLLTDTVGFIRKLPTTLIECFKSTLAEIVEADVLLHVVDVSHPAFEEHMEVVQRTLQEIDATDKPVITVFNKIDMYSQAVRVGEDYLQLPPSLEELQETFMARVPNAIFISAQQKINIDELRERIWEEARKVHERIYPNWRKPNYFDWTPPEEE